MVISSPAPPTTANLISRVRALRSNTAQASFVRSLPCSAFRDRLTSSSYRSFFPPAFVFQLSRKRNSSEPARLRLPARLCGERERETQPRTQRQKKERGEEERRRRGKEGLKGSAAWVIKISSVPLTYARTRALVSSVQLASLLSLPHPLTQKPPVFDQHTRRRALKIRARVPVWCWVRQKICAKLAPPRHAVSLLVIACARTTAAVNVVASMLILLSPPRYRRPGPTFYPSVDICLHEIE